MTPRNARPNPYVGPRAFELNERLYGRDTETRKLANLLGAERVVLLHSPSGAGKTSLIQAALIPKMRERKFHVRSVARVNREFAKMSASPPERGQEGDANGGVVSDFSTHFQPFPRWEFTVQNLPPATYNRYIFSVLSSLERASPEAEQIPEAELAGLTLAAYIERRPKPAGVNFELFIFDQFEEILTLDPTDQQAKHDFFGQMGELLADPTRWALFAMREDFLGALDPYLLPLPNRLSTTFRLDLLGVEAARQAIQTPARAAGVEFAAAAAQTLIDDLRRVQVQRPDGRFETQLGPHVEPVQLQVVCYRLWESLMAEGLVIDQEDLAALGDVGQSLAEYYAQRVAEIAAESGVRERTIREWCGRKLITAQGIRGQILMGAEQSEGLTNKVVHLLENAHLVRGEKRGGATWYELAHDRLIEPVRQNNAAWFAVNLIPLQYQAALWDEHHHSEDLLFYGQALTAAEKWSSGREDELLPHERDFLSACRKARTVAQAKIRANRRLRLAFITAVLTAIAAVWLGVQSYQRSRFSQAIALAAQSRRVLQEGDKPTAAMLAIHALSHYPYTAEAEIALGEIIRPNIALARLPIRVYPINQAAFSPDGTRIVTASDDKTARVWAAATGQELFTLAGHTERVNGAVFSPDGTRIVTASDDRTARVWAAATGETLATFEGHADWVNSAEFSPNGRHLVTTSADQTVRIWNAATGTELPERRIGQNEIVNSAAFSPDGKRIVTANAGKTVRVWDAAAGKVLAKLAEHAEGVNSAAFSPDGRFLATASADKTVRVWEAASGKVLVRLAEHAEGVNSVAFSPDGKFLATASADKTVGVWDADTHKKLASLEGHTAAVNSVAFSPDGTFILTASADGTALLWDRATAKIIRRFPSHASFTGHAASVSALALSADGSRLVSTDRDGRLYVWDVAAQKVLTRLTGDYGKVHAVAISPDGTRLVTASGEIARVWDAAAGTGDVKLVGHHGFVNSVAFSSDGARLVTASDDGTAQVWDAATGNALVTLKGHSKRVNSATFSPIGERIATASDDGTVRVWDVHTGQQLFRLAGILPLFAMKNVTFSSDGRWVGATIGNSAIKVWKLATRQVVASLAKPGELAGVAFTPDLNRIATIQGRNGHIIDLASGQELLLFSHSPNTPVIFSPQGDRILFLDPQETVQIVQFWPSRTQLQAAAQSFCHDCEPTYQERVKFRIYNWPMTVFNYWPSLAALWLLGCYAFCGGLVYRHLYGKFRYALPPIKPAFTWKRFLAASALGSVMTLAALGISVVCMIEILYFHASQIRATLSDLEAGIVVLILLFVFPLGILGGGGYSHLTRWQAGRWGWLKRIAGGGLAGIVGNFGLPLFTVVPFALMFTGDGFNVDSDELWNIALGAGTIMGFIGGILSMIGAALYIFVVQPFRRVRPTGESACTWQRFGAANGLGSLMTVALGIVIGLTVKQDYFNAHPTSAVLLLLLLLLLLFGMAAGSAYCHLTRWQMGKGWGFRRMLVGSLAGAAGNFGVTLLAGIPFFLWLYPDTELALLLLFALLAGISTGLVGGILGMAGAGLYLLVVQLLGLTQPHRESIFTWQRFLIGSGLGSLLTVAFMVDEKIDYSDAHPALFDLWLALLGIAAGAGYAYLTRLPAGKAERLKYMLVGSLFVAAGNFGSTLFIGVPFLLWISPTPEMVEIAQFSPFIGIVTGVISGLLSMPGTALYIFVAQPLARRWHQHKKG